MTTTTTAIATIQFTQAPNAGATNRNAPLHTAFATRSRPSQTPPAPTPAPRAAPLKPWQITDPVAAVTAALVQGPDPQKTVSELIELTHLPRGTVISTVAALASAGRAIREVTDVGPYLICRSSLVR